ncbi:LytTR family DNA-binding domain-containing protein [Luteibacter sp.]|uniref:LytR/AlgR family response regulator transcription factor n=1 Tax=Luteibacter sp. TaxID=1886636 RepID=UPI002F428BB6
MIRVAIADDEPLARAGVLSRLRAEPDITVVAELADGDALAALRSDTVDVAIVDVQMPGRDGLDALAAIPPAHRPLAILLTAHESFALRAFELSAVDYLLKPIDDQRFVESIDRARRQLGRTSRVVAAPRFTIRVGSKITFVDAGDVEWVEADGDYAVLHVQEARHLLREPLHILARRLDPGRFVRVHRSAIVRVDQVIEFQSRSHRDAILRLRDGSTLRASRTYVNGLLAALHRSSVDA